MHLPLPLSPAFLLFLFLSCSSIMTTTMILASPIPFQDIEKRWAMGQDEKQIHPNLSHRDMTPAWPVVHETTEIETSGSLDFATATDSRSLARSEESQSSKSVGRLMRKFFRRGGKFGDVLGEEEGEDEEPGSAPVLRPRRGEMRYYLTR